MNHYLFIAAKNKGWDVEIIQDIRPYLVKYTKVSLFFYSSKFVGIDVNHQSQLLSSDKVLTYTILKREGIDILPVDRLTDVNHEEAIDLYQKFSNNGDKPVVIKPVQSFGGKDIIKCDTFADFLTSLKKIKGAEYCITPFYEHLFEMRFIVFNKKVELIHPKYDNQTNVIRPKLPDKIIMSISRLRKMKELAVQIAHTLKFDFLAVDFLVSENDFIVIETNLTPSLFTYSDKSAKNKYKAIKLYEKIFAYKEYLLTNEKR